MCAKMSTCFTRVLSDIEWVVGSWRWPEPHKRHELTPVGQRRTTLQQKKHREFKETDHASFLQLCPIQASRCQWHLPGGSQSSVKGMACAIQLGVHGQTQAFDNEDSSIVVPEVGIRCQMSMSVMIQVAPNDRTCDAAFWIYPRFVMECSRSFRQTESNTYNFWWTSVN